MKLVPSMDLRRGRIVRLKKGVDGSEEVYPFSAAEWVARLVDAGATRVHLVDLDGAFGEAKQPELLAFPHRFPAVHFQLGGGLRTEDAIAEVLDHGFSAVVGTLAVAEPARLARFPADRIVLALDVSKGDVVVKGWTERASRPAEDLFRDLRGRGFETALVTDVEHDGLLGGPSLSSTAWVARFGFSVQASGGVRDLADLEALAALPGVDAAISGKAILDGKIPLDDARTRAALGGARW